MSGDEERRQLQVAIRTLRESTSKGTNEAKSKPSKQHCRGRPKITDRRTDAYEDSFSWRRLLIRRHFPLLHPINKFPAEANLHVSRALTELYRVTGDTRFLAACGALKDFGLIDKQITPRRLRQLARETGNTSSYLQCGMSLSVAYRQVALDFLVLFERPNNFAQAARVVSDTWRQWSGIGLPSIPTSRSCESLLFSLRRSPRRWRAPTRSTPMPTGSTRLGESTSASSWRSSSSTPRCETISPSVSHFAQAS